MHKMFKRMLFTRTKTQSANFEGSHLYQATKLHLNKSYMAKTTIKKMRCKTNSIFCFWQSCVIFLSNVWEKSSELCCKTRQQQPVTADAVAAFVLSLPQSASHLSVNCVSTAPGTWTNPMFKSSDQLSSSSLFFTYSDFLQQYLHTQREMEEEDRQTDRQRYRERQTERETQRKTKTETEKQQQRQRHRERQRDRETTMKTKCTLFYLINHPTVTSSVPGTLNRLFVKGVELSFFSQPPTHPPTHIRSLRSK